MIRKHIVFRGCVQGVGFRYRARCAADHFGCTGWVRNNWDDTVTMEIQGTPDRIEQDASSGSRTWRAESSRRRRKNMGSGQSRYRDRLMRKNRMRCGYA